MCTLIEGKHLDNIHHKYRREKKVDEEDRPFLDALVRGGAARYIHKNGIGYAVAF